MEQNNEKHLSLGLNLAKTWGPILIFGIGIGIGWATLNADINALKSRTADAQARILQLEQIPDVQQDVRWLRVNMINLLVKNGIQPVEPNQQLGDSN